MFSTILCCRNLVCSGSRGSDYYRIERLMKYHEAHSREAVPQRPRYARLVGDAGALQILAFFLLFAVTAFASHESVPTKNTQPDVFLVTIDTLRADHVGCYGYKQIETPALDGLAADGVRFAHAFTHSPITNTSHTSILTGLLPSVHGVTDFGVPLSPQHATWAELLKKKGYQTAAFIGAVILDSSTLSPGLDRGFDFYDNFPAN